MELKHGRNEKEKNTEYMVSVTDAELNQFKERITRALDQDLLSMSRMLTDIISNMVVRRILTDLTKPEK